VLPKEKGLSSQGGKGTNFSFPDEELADNGQQRRHEGDTREKGILERKKKLAFPGGKGGKSSGKKGGPFVGKKKRVREEFPGASIGEGGQKNGEDSPFRDQGTKERSVFLQSGVKKAKKRRGKTRSPNTGVIWKEKFSHSKGKKSS